MTAGWHRAAASHLGWQGAHAPALGSTVLHPTHFKVFAGSPKGRQVFGALRWRDYDVAVPAFR